MSTLRCPVCKAENTTPTQCRRCKADLSLLWQLEAQRRRALATAAAALARGDADHALPLLDAAEAARPGPDSLRLRAVCLLLQRDFAAAWRARQLLRS